jgi:hypothetical protein
MALPTRAARVTASKSSRQDAWKLANKALAFLNINLTGKSTVKLGALSLRESNSFEKSMFDKIGGDAAKAARLKDVFVLTYNSVNSGSTGLDFLDDLDYVGDVTDGDSTRNVIGYLNFAMPTGDATTRIGSIALLNNNPTHLKLDVWLNQDASNLDKLQDSMTVVYHSSTPEARECPEW